MNHFRGIRGTAVVSSWLVLGPGVMRAGGEWFHALRHDKRWGRSMGFGLVCLRRVLS